MSSSAVTKVYPLSLGLVEATIVIPYSGQYGLTLSLINVVLPYISLHSS